MLIEIIIIRELDLRMEKKKDNTALLYFRFKKPPIVHYESAADERIVDPRGIEKFLDEDFRAIDAADFGCERSPCKTTRTTIQNTNCSSSCANIQRCLDSEHLKLPTTVVFQAEIEIATVHAEADPTIDPTVTFTGAAVTRFTSSCTLLLRA